VSLVANYRSSFAAEIRARGIEGLIRTLAARNRGDGGHRGHGAGAERRPDAGSGAAPAGGEAGPPSRGRAREPALDRGDGGRRR